MDNAFNWVGMAHKYCIDNGVIVWIFIIGWFVVALYYVKFVKINEDIRAIKKVQKQADADKTFKWFAYTFWTCAITRVLSSITMFYGVYWLEAIGVLVNAVVIFKTYYVYKRQKKLFVAKVYSIDDVNKGVSTGRLNMRDEILSLDISDEAKQQIKLLKQAECLKT